MNHHRRTILKASSSLTALSLAVAAGLMKPAEVFAAADYLDKAFNAKSLDELMRALGGSLPTESAEIILSAPDIAENGTSVRVGAESKLKNTTEICFLVANNPAMMSAQFIVPPGTDANVATNLKISKTGDVYSLVKADGKYYFAKKEVRVTLGGCSA